MAAAASTSPFSITPHHVVHNHILPSLLPLKFPLLLPPLTTPHTPLRPTGARVWLRMRSLTGRWCCPASRTKEVSVAVPWQLLQQ
jgi:hypothetical protein